jgi:hypothetical protein
MTFNIVVFRRSLCGFVCRKVVDVVCISYCVGDHKVSLASIIRTRRILNRSRTHAIANIKDSDTTSTNDGENENADFIDLVRVEIKEECHFILFLEKERFDNTLPSTQTSKFTGHRSTPSGDSGPILPPTGLYHT